MDGSKVVLGVSGVLLVLPAVGYRLGYKTKNLLRVLVVLSWVQVQNWGMAQVGVGRRNGAASPLSMFSVMFCPERMV